MIYSHSRIKSFKTCPLRFRFVYIDRLKPAERFEGIEAFMGCRVHECLEFLYKELKWRSKPPTLDALITLYDLKWNESWNDDVRVVNKEYSPDDYKVRGRRMLENYYASHSPFDSEPRTVSLEARMMLDLKDAERHRLQLLIDRLSIASNGAFELHDYKTSSTIPTQDDLDRDDQLSLYALFVRDAYNVPAGMIRLVWHFLEFEKDMYSMRSDAQLDAFRDRLLRDIQSIESCTEFPARPSGLCRWCEFASICPEMSHLITVKSIPEPERLEEDGVRLVERLAELESRKDGLEDEIARTKDELVDFAKSKGVNRVFGTTHSAGIRETERVSFPGKNDPKRPELEAELKRRGIWDEVATLDAFALERLLKEDTHLAEAVSAFKSTKKSVTVMLKELRN